MKRRRFMFWVSLGMFSLGERLGLDALDRLAAATLEETDDAKKKPAETPPVHWRAASNSTWQWYERETMRNDRWIVTGITTPINRKTGEPYTGAKGYLDESLVPQNLRIWDPDGLDHVDGAKADAGEHRPDPQRRARHGRPPSKWLRSLRADELRIWLKTIDVPEASVIGMTFWDHLTQDHFFDAEKIAGLSIDDQAKLHAAAHYGY